MFTLFTQSIFPYPLQSEERETQKRILEKREKI
nr:MAG TPA: hypothetical protein [Caudoviricetes sp.]